jgi:hypothetical protein
MHAVVVHVSLGDPEGARRQLHERVVPGVSKAPGFVSGVWMNAGPGKGHSVVVFESEEAASAMAERVPGLVPESVTVDNVSVHEVVAHA